MQGLRTVTPADFCSNLFCLQSEWFLADILLRYPGNGQRRRRFSVSCRFMKQHDLTPRIYVLHKITIKLEFPTKMTYTN